jgi:hypothetical protein
MPDIRLCYAEGCAEMAAGECENCAQPYCEDHEGQKGGDRWVEGTMYGGWVAYPSLCEKCS